MSNSIVHKLFRRRRPIPEFPGVDGQSAIPVPARRNSGSAAVSAIVLKGVIKALTGAVHEVSTASHRRDGGRVVLTRHDGHGGEHRASGLAFDAGGQLRTLAAPNGLTYGVTYHCVLTWLAEALTRPAEAVDLLDAYQDMLELWWDEYHCQRPSELAGRTDFRNAVLRICDEAYMWLRYGPDPNAANDRLAGASVGFVADLEPGLTRPERRDDVVQAMNDLGALRRLRQGVAPAPAPAAAPAPVEADTAFVGWQFGELRMAVEAGEHALLAGPTGSGKTSCVQEVMRALDRPCVVCRGMEGLCDLDVIGAIVPRPGGAREWVDGPLVRAMRMAQAGPVTFFLDEITRMPRVHLNLLPGLLDPQSGDDLRRQGVEVEGPGLSPSKADGPFYTLELPMLSEVVWAPCEHFQLVAAGNFGRQYTVYAIDPAVRRRFSTVLEYDYLAFDQETALVRQRTGLNGHLGQTLVKLAAETRRLHTNGELPGALDTASLLAWAAKAAARGACPEHSRRAGDADALLRLAEITWMDQVAGRDHAGAVDEANAAAIGDLLRDMLA